MRCSGCLLYTSAFFKRLGKRLDAHVADKLLRDGRVRLKDCKSPKGKTYKMCLRDRVEARITEGRNSSKHADPDTLQPELRHKGEQQQQNAEDVYKRQPTNTLPSKAYCTFPSRPMAMVVISPFLLS